MQKVVEVFKATYKIPCTGCEYCMPCPQNVNIPGCFASYNSSYSLGRLTSMFQYTTSTAANREENGAAGRCIGCGKCVKQCPQHIAIPERLKEVERRMEPFYYKWLMSRMRKRAKRGQR